MSSLGMYELTHPESLSESQLKEILENRCIDFSDYKHFSKSDLIELYKRVALPLPQRQSENIQNFDTKGYNEEIYSTNEFHRKLVLLRTHPATSNGLLNEFLKNLKTRKETYNPEMKQICKGKENKREMNINQKNQLNGVNNPAMGHKQHKTEKT
ncbi:hypothetical protein WN48_11111 [Eufriesea mexicana]|nr:hypothetical protein WN48_11111 [Eufriesea mexicana]